MSRRRRHTTRFIDVDDRYPLAVTRSKTQPIDRDAVNRRAPSQTQNMRLALEVPDLYPPSYPIPGDASTFIADITIPNGTIMRPYHEFEKT